MRINPLNTGNPMTFKDAAIVAAIAAFIFWILNFFVSASMGQIRADPAAFIFDAIKAYAVAWAANFLTFSGLKQLLKEGE